MPTDQNVEHLSETMIEQYLFTAFCLRQTVRLEKMEVVMVTAGRVALVTGSTDGVGRYVARKLAAAGMKVLVHGRDRARAAAVVRSAHEAGGSAQFYLADFSSLAEVRELARAVAQDHGEIDILINNAGIGVDGNYPGRQESKDGIELRFAVNYLAGFLLTRLLLPRLRRAAGTRIVNVASVGQQAIDFDDVMLTRGYSGTRAYCQSKLAQIMFTIDLAEELAGSGITVNALHPATYMDTTMLRGDGLSPLSSVADGGKAILQLALGPATADRTGLYFDGTKEKSANAQSYDAAARARLRQLSFELAGIPMHGDGGARAIVN